MEFALWLSYIFIPVATYLATIHLYGKLLKRPPSPFLCFPVIGHLYIVNDIMSEAFRKLTNHYGPIIFLWFGSRPALLVSSPSAAEECLNKNDVVFCNRPSKTIASKYRGHQNGSINFAPYGPQWRNLRKISAVHILSSHRLQSLASVRSHEVRLLIKQLSTTTNLSEVVEMRKNIFDTTMNIMTRMVFGKRYYGAEACTEEAKRLREMVVDATNLLNEPFIGDDIPYLGWLGRSIEKRFKQYKERRDTLMMELIEEHQNRLRETKGNVVHENKPLIQTLLELQESDPEQYNNDVVQGIIVDLIIGGSQTSMSAIECALSLLLNHPQVLQKARKEIDNYVGNTRFVEETDLNNLPYLGCIINETLRMYPPLPFLFPHESSEDCVVGGYRIVRGTYLLINIYGIQNDSQLWDEPKSFKPERFQGVEGHKIGYKMMPFGSGRRSCPGEGFAIRVMGMMLATIIQCLDLERVDDKLVDMSLSDSFDLVKAEPLMAKIKTRQVMSNLLQKL